MDTRQAVAVLERESAPRALVRDWVDAPRELALEWVVFLRAMEDVYERLAALHGEPYRRCADDDLDAAAHLVAALGTRPRDVCARGVLWPATGFDWCGGCDRGGGT